jgi:hypothetical protein
MRYGRNGQNLYFKYVLCAKMVSTHRSESGNIMLRTCVHRGCTNHISRKEIHEVSVFVQKKKVPD